MSEHENQQPNQEAMDEAPADIIDSEVVIGHGSPVVADEAPDYQQVEAIQRGVLSGALGIPRSLSISDRMNREIEHLEMRLRQVKELRAKMEAQPEVAELLDMVKKAGF